MKIYIKNTDTNEILTLEAESYDMLSKNFRTAPYELASEAEVNLELLKEAKALRVNPRQQYLSSTDWYIAREADEPNSYPQAVKNKRLQARNEINEIEASTTLEEVEAYNINFE